MKAPTETEKAQHTAEPCPFCGDAMRLSRNEANPSLDTVTHLWDQPCILRAQTFFLDEWNTRASIPDPAIAVPALVALAERIEWLATAGEDRDGVPCEVTPGDWGRLWNQARAALALAQGGKR